MPQIRYVGPFDAVDIKPDPDRDEWVTVENGEVVEVAEAEGFLVQTENWIDPSDKPPPQAHPDTTAMTRDEVLEWVDGDPGRAGEALARENGADKPRSTLIAELEKLTTPEDDR